MSYIVILKNLQRSLSRRNQRGRRISRKIVCKVMEVFLALMMITDVKRNQMV